MLQLSQNIHRVKRRKASLPCSVTVKLPSTQRKQIDEEAASLGLTKSEYCRRLLFENRREGDTKLMRQIWRMAWLIASKSGATSQEIERIVKETS
jgi:hypothetical protein